MTTLFKVIFLVFITWGFSGVAMAMSDIDQFLKYTKLWIWVFLCLLILAISILLFFGKKINL